MSPEYSPRVDLGGGSSFRNDNTEWFYAQVNKKNFRTGINPFEVCGGGGGVWEGKK